MKSFKKLKTKLAELFQLDQADLDFGIYRIMNARRDEINQFLESELLPQVREAFGEYKSSDRAEIQKELDKVVEGVKTAGMDPEQAPKVKELRARLAEEAVDVTALENEVYDHLYNFFSRYYDEGDFISLRRYKEGVYAIPYEGEEVKLHWANHDQYYIKTTEHFRDYAFKTPIGHRVHFKIAEADTEKDNIKAANGNDRRFLLHGDKPVAEENDELVIRFEYRPDGEKRRQDVINADTAKRIIADLNEEKLAVWKDRLTVMWKRARGKESDKTILDKHLFDYTRRNTFDYFIHKDLEGFLRRELDFYVKNEVMRLDDIEEESAPHVEQYLSKIKVIRRIAHKIIDFLAQIENFQKKLWLKKKFVIETNYCVTLDRVPEELYPEIAANDAQREEWVRLFAIDEIEKDLAGSVDYTEPLSIEFLKANQFLVLDTNHFNSHFKDKLLSNFAEIETEIDGLLIHSENEQGLRLLVNALRGKVSTIYLDPPYNTGKDEFCYKDAYQHSSWISMMYDRIGISRSFMNEKCALFCSVDEKEVGNLRSVLGCLFGPNNHLADFIWQTEGNFDNQAKIKIAHEYILAYAFDEGRFESPLIVDPSIKEGSKLFKPEIRNTIVKNGPKNPISELNLPPGFPATFNESKIDKDQVEWPKYDKDVVVQNGKLKDAIVATSGWSSKSLCEQFINTGFRPVLDSKKQETIFQISHTGAIEAVKKRGEKPSYVISIIKGVGTTQSTSSYLESLGTPYPFYPKPVNLIKYIVSMSNDSNGITLDYFAGSGTTAHAVINLNSEDEGNRKYILFEMGDYFNTVLKPRIQKIIYSKNWKNCKPVSRDGVSHMFKYIRLESYEDALANIELQRTGPQQLLLDRAGDFRESYMLKYMLDVESRGSQTLLNIDKFDDPWNYKLLVGAGSVGETRPVNVDLVETFNWLLGLKVVHIDRISGFQVIEGENPEGKKVLVIWRRLRDLAETDPEKIAAAREQANRDLEAFFKKQQYNTLDSEFDVVYVNGDNNLMNVPLDPDKEGVEPRYKVRLIEEEFRRLMFDVAGV